MSQPMLTVSSKDTTDKSTQINLLPCRIHHDGEVEPIESYWQPVEERDGRKVAYLRGRKLDGSTTKLPEGYYGSVVEKGETRREVPRQDEMDPTADVEELPEAIEVAPMNGKAQFDNIVIWGHESMADSTADPYVRSVEEWIALADQIHSYPSPETVST